MRTLSSLALLLAFASCTAIDNFGKFTVGNGDGGAGCTAGCDCIPADAALGVPAHCRVAPLNAFNCTAAQRMTVTLGAGDYTLDSGLSTPVLKDTSGRVLMSGTITGVTALFCVGSFIADNGVHIAITGDHPVAIVADSLIRQSNGGWALAGDYATSETGAAGVGGGSTGGDSGNAGVGTGGGKGGVGMPGAGGGGGSAATPGATGGSTMGGATTMGGSVVTPSLVGYGGGGGGKGTVNGGGGGGGAGALQLSASYAITLDAVAFNASGGGGGGGFANGGTGTGTAGGGGGGGGGGTIALDAPTVGVTGGCLSVIGGPGGGGGAVTRGGDAHGDPNCPFVGTGGIAPLSGGGGGAPAGATNGGNGTAGGGGGGGLGGSGRVLIRAHNPPATPNVTPATAYVAQMLVP